MKLFRKPFVLFFLILSCNSRQKVQTFNNGFEGITKRIIGNKEKIIVDSIYDDSGSLIKTIDYYGDTSHIKLIRNYKKDRLDGISLEYYFNQNLKSKRYYYEGKECFERMDFTENDKMANYSFLASDQSRLYVRVYDTSGNCISERGAPFFESFMYSNANFIFSEEDTVTTYFYAPNPPDCTVKLYTVYDTVSVNNIKPLNEKFIYRVRIYPLRKGSYEWLVGMKIFSNKNDSLIYESDLKRIEYTVR